MPPEGGKERGREGEREGGETMEGETMEGERERERGRKGERERGREGETMEGERERERGREGEREERREGGREGGWERQSYPQRLVELPKNTFKTCHSWFPQDLDSKKLCYITLL